MKGVIFVELIKMAEAAFGEDTVDEVLDKADLDNGGVFTAVGNYPCSELVKIVLAFSAHSGHSPEALQLKFGEWMLTFFVAHYPEFFRDKTTAFALLESVDQEIHVEVRKLYPDAELPRFSTTRQSDQHMEMVYTSPRPLEVFCQGLIEACLVHFGETAKVTRSTDPTDARTTTFDISLTQ